MHLLPRTRAWLWAGSVWGRPQASVMRLRTPVRKCYAAIGTRPGLEAIRHRYPGKLVMMRFGSSASPNPSTAPEARAPFSHIDSVPRPPCGEHPAPASGSSPTQACLGRACHPTWTPTTAISVQTPPAKAVAKMGERQWGRGLLFPYNTPLPRQSASSSSETSNHQSTSRFNFGKHLDRFPQLFQAVLGV